MIEVTAFPVSAANMIMVAAAIVGAIVFLVFFAAVHYRGVEGAIGGVPGIALFIVTVAGMVLALVCIAGPSFARDSTLRTLESAYGIERLECCNTDCTWIAGGDPGAGTLVQRDNMAGLLDANQKPLPLKRSAQ